MSNRTNERLCICGHQMGHHSQKWHGCYECDCERHQHDVPPGNGPCPDCPEARTENPKLARTREELLQDANDSYVRIIRKQEVEIERLRAALQEYGQHTASCSTQPHWNHHPSRPCDCGFREALVSTISTADSATEPRNDRK